MISLGAREDRLRHRLVVVEDGVRRVDDPVAGLARPQAEINVVEGDRKVVGVEAADFGEERAAHQGAGEGDGAVVADHVRQSEVARGSLPRIA